MVITPEEQRLVPRHRDPGVAFLSVEYDLLGLELWSISPSHNIWDQETVFCDPRDGSRISYRVDRLTYVPHVAISGGRAGEFRDWAIATLDCWTESELFELAEKTLAVGDVDDIVDALLVLFISCPPIARITDSWVSLALEFLRHEDPDVRDSAVVGSFFGFWRDSRIQEEIDHMLKCDPSEAVRSRAAIVQKGWGEPGGADV